MAKKEKLKSGEERRNANGKAHISEIGGKAEFSKDGKNVILTLPVKERESKSGKTMLITSTRGNVDTGLKSSNGKPILLGANAFYRAEGGGKKNKGKTKAKAKVEDDDCCEDCDCCCEEDCCCDDCE